MTSFMQYLLDLIKSGVTTKQPIQPARASPLARTVSRQRLVAPASGLARARNGAVADFL